MKRCLVLVMLLAVAVTAQANILPNGDFQTMLKPGEPTVTATAPDGCYWSIPDMNIKGGGPATYSDGTTGDSIETPGWVIGAGSKTNADCMIGGAWGGPDGLGDVAGMAFAGWGGPTYIATAAPLSLPAGAYALSADIYNNGGPVILELLDSSGAIVTPTTESTPALIASDWVEFTRTYNILAGDYTVQVGTRDDINDPPVWTGNRVSIDNVTLVPEPATMLLLGLGGLLLRRKRS